MVEFAKYLPINIKHLIDTYIQILATAQADAEKTQTKQDDVLYVTVLLLVL